MFKARYTPPTPTRLNCVVGGANAPVGSRRELLANSVHTADATSRRCVLGLTYAQKLTSSQLSLPHVARTYKKLSYCWETVRRESMPRIAEMDVEMKT